MRQKTVVYQIGYYTEHKTAPTLRQFAVYVCLAFPNILLSMPAFRNVFLSYYFPPLFVSRIDVFTMRINGLLISIFSSKGTHETIGNGLIAHDNIAPSGEQPI
jgi:hypothetical protein